MDQWADLADQFVDVHYGSLRGRVRTHVLDRQLSWHMPWDRLPRSVVDVGGGAGNQSIPLARIGHQVTIVDSSPAMLGRAEEALCRSKTTEVSGPGHGSCMSSGRGCPSNTRRRDVRRVLCHGVIMYVPDPLKLVARLLGSPDPRGLVSIVSKNAASMATRPALQGDWAAALEAFDQRHQTNGLGVDTVAHTLDEIDRDARRQRGGTGRLVRRAPVHGWLGAGHAGARRRGLGDGCGARGEPPRSLPPDEQAPPHRGHQDRLTEAS